MIRVGIDGAGTPEAGELIRLLINHPDVELVQIAQPEYVGRNVSDIHHGLIGEKEISFSRELDAESLDIIFYTRASSENTLSASKEFVASKDELDSGFAIYMDPSEEMYREAYPYYLHCIDDTNDDVNQEDWSKTIVYGVPELNRKPLVRGGRRAIVPTAIESVATVALLPFIEKVSFGEALSLKIKGDEAVLEELEPSKNSIAARLSELLKELTGKRIAVELQYEYSKDWNRSISVSIDFPATLTLDEMRREVEERYDDHHLSHLTVKHISHLEVEGTDKCLIEVNNAAPGYYRVTAIADARMRGGAGEAIHIMNLLAGLFEKTGLHLKASNF